MNDPTPDPHDDLLRAALRAEADGVVADDALRQRVVAATTAAPSRRAAWLVAAAAVVALVAGVGVVASQGDDEQEVDAIDPAATTTTTVADDLNGAIAGLFDCAEGTIQLVVLTAPGTSDADQAAVAAALSPDGVPGAVTDHAPAEVLERLEGEGLAPEGLAVDAVPTAWVASFTDPDAELEVRSTVSDLPGVTTTSSTDCLDTGVAAADRPDTIVLVREDGWLVVVDADGEQRELHFGGDPAGPPAGQEEGGPQFIDDVELSPDGRWVYFSTCCEPASGITFRIPVDGGEPEQIAFGAYPAVSPDGRWLATATGETVSLAELGSADELVSSGEATLPTAATLEVGCCARGLTWSPDGSELAFTVAFEADAEPEVQRLAWDGTTLTPVDPGKPDNPGWFAAWNADGVPETVLGDPISDDRSLAQDRSYEWRLWVDQDGTLLAQGPGATGDRTPLDGLPKALVADW